MLLDMEDLLSGHGLCFVCLLLFLPRLQYYCGHQIDH